MSEAGWNRVGLMGWIMVGIGATWAAVTGDVDEAPRVLMGVGCIGAIIAGAHDAGWLGKQ